MLNALTTQRNNTATAASARHGLVRVRALSYDGFGRLASINNKSASQQTLMQRAYQYDPMSNITSIASEQGNYAYQYDKLYHLTQADNPNGIADEQYTYDKLGNRLADAQT